MLCYRYCAFKPVQIEGHQSYPPFYVSPFDGNANGDSNALETRFIQPVWIPLNYGMSKFVFLDREVGYTE